MKKLRIFDSEVDLQVDLVMAVPKVAAVHAFTA
jgi:hypothetical protein